MKTSAAVATALILLSGGAYLARGQSAPAAETPQAVYADVQALQAEVQSADSDIKALEFQIERLRAERSNYRYVKERNEEGIRRLREWAEAE